MSVPPLDPYATFADVAAAMSPGLPDHAAAMAVGVELPPEPGAA